MYRYSVDSAITYTSEDFVLFKESPFASFMERLSLENPDHGIPPDEGSLAPVDSLESQADLAETLRASGKHVKLIDWQMPEPMRRNATLEAMRHGVDFVVDGQLALGPLSGSSNLLMRTSGFSDLGNFLYVPCDTQGKTTLHSAFRLCFLADLLHSLQGQLPPQLLIIRGGQEVLPLQTDDHIYHYRAVKKRFMDAQREFRKHRMPDPAESSHFGRWGACANELIKQRLLSQPVEEESAEVAEQPQPLADALVAGLETATPDTAQPGQPLTGQMGAGTLAEQAREMREQPAPSAVAPEPTLQAEDALENLSFIGSRRGRPIAEPTLAPSTPAISEAVAPPAPGSAPPPDSLGVSPERQAIPESAPPAPPRRPAALISDSLNTSGPFEE